MPRLRRLSGREVVRILARFGFTVHSQRGSHVKLRRVTSEGRKQTLTIPYCIGNSTQGRVAQSCARPPGKYQRKR